MSRVGDERRGGGLVGVGCDCVVAKKMAISEMKTVKLLSACFLIVEV